jgi:hypothetical protein
MQFMTGGGGKIGSCWFRLVAPNIRSLFNHRPSPNCIKENSLKEKKRKRKQKKPNKNQHEQQTQPSPTQPQPTTQQQPTTITITNTNTNNNHFSISIIIIIISAGLKTTTTHHRISLIHLSEQEPLSQQPTQPPPITALHLKLDRT